MRRSISRISCCFLALAATSDIASGSGNDGGSFAATRADVATAAPDWRDIDSRYAYAGDDPGVRYDATRQTATFAIWAPTARTVVLRFFDPGNPETRIGSELALVPDRRTGVWRTMQSAKNLGVARLAGVFYQYLIDGRPALDPYARSMAADDGSTNKAAIVDLNLFKPSGFARIPGYTRREDAIIYEMHVRDFTVDPAIEGELHGQPFGTFSAFIEKLDYLRALGVTHIQLMPVMACLYDDETRSRTREWAWTATNNNYNWGYDPHNFFSPDGMYASDPRNPQKRVDELKRLVQAIHERGMGVILDVVYSHHPVASIFDPIVPGYYYRGRNDSGAGTDIASERVMVRKLIVDSLAYWTGEYRVDGFRFDLMSLIDADTIRAGYERVASLNPNALFIGEGWRMFKGNGPRMADQDWVLDQDFAAVFSDDFRDVIKSGFGDEGAPRFITGGAEDIAYLFANIKGEPSKNFRTDDPGDAVQYIAAHDNLTLHDVIAVATGLDPDRAVDEATIQRRIRLGNAILLSSQGIAFLHGGQEYGRSNRWRGDGVPRDATRSRSGDVYFHNAYDAPDIVNHFDWSAVTGAGDARDTMHYTAGLIALRRSSDAFRLGSRAAVDANVQRIDSPDIAARDRVLAFRARATTGETYYVFVNADARPRRIRIGTDLRAGAVVVDAQTAGTNPIANPRGLRVGAAAIDLDALGAAVIRMPATAR